MSTGVPVYWIAAGLTAPPISRGSEPSSVYQIVPGRRRHRQVESRRHLPAVLAERRRSDARIEPVTHQLVQHDADAVGKIRIAAAGVRQTQNPVALVRSNRRE